MPLVSAALLLALLAETQSMTTDNYHHSGKMASPERMTLVWSDEFGDTRIDANKWSFDTSRNKEGWWNGERQYYSADRPENLRVKDGRLIIEARRERLDPKRFPDWGGQDYTSARIFSKGEGWTYGFYEIRAKLPCARGTWPAIWMLPVDLKEWPDDGEIDIMEHVGSEPNMLVASLHTALFNHAIKTQRSGKQPLPTSCSQFHRYQLDWRPESITIGVDDEAYMQVKNDQHGGKGAWPFNVPFNLILNLAIGGDWAGAKGIDDKAMPERFEVDYVRVWQGQTAAAAHQ